MRLNVLNRGRLYRLAACLALSLPVSVEANAELRYIASIAGVADPEQLETLTRLSDTINQMEEPPASLIHLRRRVNEDEDRLVEALRSQGYFGAKVDAAIEASGDPVSVVLHVDQGERYRIRSVEAGAATDMPALPPPGDLGLGPGAVATADAILEAEKQLVQHLRNHGYAYAVAEDRRVVVDHAQRSVAVTYTLSPGTATTFGDVTIVGLEKVKETAVRNLVAWEPNSVYDESQIEETERRLYDAGLFSIVNVEPAETPEASGAVPVRISLEERKHRTYALGLRYDTDQGAGAELSWEHRNARGKGHRLNVEGKFRTEVSEIEVGYRIPRFHRDDQTLHYALRIAREDLEAYTSNLFNSEVAIERKLSEHLTLGTGVGLRISRSTQLGETRNHHLVYVPLRLQYDRSNDKLNPTRGYRINFLLQPHLDFIEFDSAFLQVDAEFSHYLSLDAESDWVLATRTHLGSLIGEDTRGIPPSLRYYAGGGGSIRGYPYKTVSPLSGNDPIGGRSLLEASIEIRRRISETIGVVGFVDAGMAFDESWPSFDEQVRYAAGVGVRYFTSIGPLRFDVAVPLNRRKDIDDLFEFYISIGQSF